MGLFSFSNHKKRSIFHGGGYYTGGYLHSNSSRRYYDPRCRGGKEAKTPSSPID